jgi:hypothetical protein
VWGTGVVALVGSGGTAVLRLDAPMQEDIALAREETVLQVDVSYAKASKQAAAVYSAISKEKVRRWQTSAEVSGRS